MTELALRQALKDSVDEVLEKMFFAETLGEASLAGEPSLAPSDELHVQLSFEGEPPGVMCLRLTAAAARQIAADFLGVDEPEISETQVSEVARELANMICGSVLSRVESAATFRLGVPEIVALEAVPPRALSNTRYCVHLFHGRLAVNIATGTSLCPRPVESAY